MSERQTNSATSRIGIIDLGSNSLRLAVFERHGGVLFPMINEKVMCGLARGLSTSGRLNRDGMTMAMVNLRRFVALAHAIGVDHLAVLATAAVRDASDGQVFADEVARECRVPVAIIDGAEEARLSAAGVLAGIPEAEGIVCDLGGGSVELVRVGPGLAAEGGRIGHGITLPLGPLRLAEFGDNAKAVSEAVERSLAAAPVARAGIGQNLYLVGGASRALARLHMDHTHYPLHIVHHYTIARAEAEAFFEIIGRLSRKSLERITTISRKRLEMVPLAAVMLRKLVAVAGPQRVIFSAFGLARRLCLRSHSAGRAQPRSADCRVHGDCAAPRAGLRRTGTGCRNGRRRFFPRLSDRMRRLHRAACWLGDIAWIEHPDYRAEQAFSAQPEDAVSPRSPTPTGCLSPRCSIPGTAGQPTPRSATRPGRCSIRKPPPKCARSASRCASPIHCAAAAIELLSEAWLGRDGAGLVLEVPPGRRLCLRARQCSAASTPSPARSA